MAKEININCNLYLAVEDDADAKDALNRVLAMLDPALEWCVHDYVIQDRC